MIEDANSFVSCLVAGMAFGVAVTVGCVLMRRTARVEDCLARRYNALRELFRAELLAGGKDKVKAYHVAEDGSVLVADAERFYAALFSGIHDFWETVAVYGGESHRVAVPVDEMKFGDGECRLTRISCACGETYVDAVFPDNLPYPYLCARATSEDLKKAVVERKAKSAERAGRDGGVEYGAGSHGRIIADFGASGRAVEN